MNETCDVCLEAPVEHLMPPPKGTDAPVGVCRECVVSVEHATDRRYLGFIYFIQAENGGPVKIGWSLEEPQARLIDLQIGNPNRLIVRQVLPGTRRDEIALHRRLGHLRLRGEWFEEGALAEVTI